METTYLLLYLLGGVIATQTVTLAYPIRDDADVDYVRDLLAGSDEAGRSVHVLGWSVFTPDPAADGESGT